MNYLQNTPRMYGQCDGVDTYFQLVFPRRMLTTVTPSAGLFIMWMDWTTLNPDSVQWLDDFTLELRVAYDLTAIMYRCSLPTASPTFKFKSGKQVDTFVNRFVWKNP